MTAPGATKPSATSPPPVAMALLRNSWNSWIAVTKPGSASFSTGLPRTFHETRTASRNSTARISTNMPTRARAHRSEEHTSELQSQFHLVCRLLLEKKKNDIYLTLYLEKTNKKTNNATE